MHSSSPLPLSLAPPRGVPSFCGPGGGVTGGLTGAAVFPIRNALPLCGWSIAALDLGPCADCAACRGTSSSCVTP